MKNIKRISIQLVGIATMALFTIIATGCLDNDDNANIPAAYVTLYHGSPDAPDLTIKADNRPINTYAFEYADYTGYLRFFPGDRNLKFGPFSASNIQIDTTVAFEVGQGYSVFVAGLYATSGIVVLNDNSAQPVSGKSKIRVIHLSPDAPEIDFVATGNAIASNLEFKEASDFLEVNAQEYDFEVKAGDEVLLTVPDITLQSGYLYTIVIRGFVDPPGENTNVLAAQVLVN